MRRPSSRSGRGRAVGAIAAAALCAGAFASSAAAQAIGVAPKCVVNANPAVGSPMGVAGSGFTAGDMIELTANGAFGTTTAGATGGFATAIKAPILSTPFPAASKFTLAAQDETNGTTKATTTFWVANLAFKTSPSAAKPSKKVHFSFSGFKSGATIYGHYVHGKTAATQRFGKATGICGLLKAKAQLFPGGNPKFNRYKVQIDDSRRYRAKSLPRIDSSLTIERF
jgi:hypothetical protein